MRQDYDFGIPILGDATVVIARVTRSTSNALRVQLATPDGTELAHARQKSGLGVLLGIKNGGKSDYASLPWCSGTPGQSPTAHGIIGWPRPPATNSVS